MAVAANGNGYWFTAADGGVFAFGDAPFYGSLGNIPQSRPVVAMTATANGRGYWFTNSNGAVTAYGDATYWGSAPQVIAQPVVGMAEADATGNFTGSSYPSGSYGYDISNYQAATIPPPPTRWASSRWRARRSASTRIWPRRPTGPAVGSTSTPT